MVSMSAELSAAIEQAGPRATASLMATLRHTGTPGEPETELRKLLADVLDGWGEAEVGVPDQTLIDFMANWVNVTRGGVYGTKTGYKIRQSEAVRDAGPRATPMGRLNAAVWCEVDAAVLAADLAGLLDTGL